MTLDKDLKVKIDMLASMNNTSRSKIIESTMEELVAKMGNDDGKPMVVSVMSFKGGTAKTTSIVNLSTLLASYGKRVLCIDLDPQGNLSQTFHVYDTNVEESCIMDILCQDSAGKHARIEDVMATTNIDAIYPDKLYVVRADLRAISMNNMLINEMSNVSSEVTNRLKLAIEEMYEHFDYIFIDCPPALNLITTNAIVALEAGNSHSMIIIPIKTDLYSSTGLDEQLNAIERTSHRTPNIRLLFTIVERNTQSYSRAVEVISEMFDDYKQFDTYIPKGTAVMNVSWDTLPLCIAAPRSKVTQAYKALAAEIMEMNNDAK